MGWVGLGWVGLGWVGFAENSEHLVSDRRWRLFPENGVNSID